MIMTTLRAKLTTMTTPKGKPTIMTTPKGKPMTMITLRAKLTTMITLRARLMTTTIGEPQTSSLTPTSGITPATMAAMVEVIATNLAQVNPDQADFYQDNAAQLSAQFTELDGWIQTQVDTIPVNNRRLVTTHDAFRYFADAYDFEVKGALSGLSTEEKPSAGALTALVDQVKGATVPAIFCRNHH